MAHPLPSVVNFIMVLYEQISTNIGAKKIAPRSNPLNSKGSKGFERSKIGARGANFPNNKSLSRSYIVTTAKAFSLFGG